jgi:hypothetical protein
MPVADITLPAPPSVDALRARIGWFCHLLRLAGPLYAGWVLVTMIVFWSDTTMVTRVYGLLLHSELGAIPSMQRAAGFAVHFVIWLFTAVACLGMWRLFSGFLDGRVFTLDTALQMRHIALFGLVAELGDLLTRPLVSLFVTAHMPTGSHHVNVFFQPSDLLNIMFLVGFLALGHVFKVAAEIAEDHAAIV